MDLYVILGLEHGATESEIKRAYRRLARRYHPDINPGDWTAEARFRQILEAYETLMDPERRTRYDSGSPIGDEDRRTSGFEGFDFSGRGGDHAATFGDLFAEVFTSRGEQRPAPERGVDLHHTFTLSFEAAFNGTQRTVTVTRRETCRTCAGTGLTRLSTGACLVCQGAGSVRTVRGHMVFTRSCPGCGSSVRVRASRAEERGSRRAPSRWRCGSRPGWPTASAFASPARATPGSAAARPAISTSP